MASNFGTVTMCTVAIGGNAIYQVRKGHDPFGTVLAGSIFMGACVLIGAVEPSVGSALAAVFLISVLIGRGEEIFSVFTDLASAS